MLSKWSCLTEIIFFFHHVNGFLLWETGESNLLYFSFGNFFSGRLVSSLSIQNLTIIMNVMIVALIKSAAICNVTVTIAQDDLCSVRNNALKKRFKITAVMFSLIFQYKRKWQFTPFCRESAKKTSILILCVTVASFKINYNPLRFILANKVAHNLLVTYSIGFTNGNSPVAGLHSNKQSTMDNPKS
jgi:hypothetical protein